MSNKSEKRKGSKIFEIRPFVLNKQKFFVKPRGWNFMLNYFLDKGGNHLFFVNVVKFKGRDILSFRVPIPQPILWFVQEVRQNTTDVDETKRLLREKYKKEISPEYHYIFDRR